jgi:tol-pal system protein YbgF
MRQGFSVLALLTVFVLVQGCASTGDLDIMKGDINQLKRDTLELKRQSTGTVKEDSFNAIRESQSSLYSQVADLSKDLQVLRGRFDENKFFMDKALKDHATEREMLRAQINSLEARVKELNERYPKPSETRPPTTDQKPGPEGMSEKGPEPQRTDENSPLSAYESAYNAFKEKRYKEAREKFSAFIKRFPKDSLVGNAHFWTGETYYAEKDFENAILSYETLIKNYSRNEKIPGALLKQGLSFIEIGDKKTAKVIFDKLIEKYPESKEAEQAKKKKAEIDKKPKKMGSR